eukprot:GHVS01053179.1.p2 GENE.GHVS01053179.1~~GHVS01053179.1.p2  ORF type:complete len:114 (-),score=14.34 GHVS01053179.1:255-596(-)
MLFGSGDSFVHMRCYRAMQKQTLETMRPPLMGQQMEESDSEDERPPLTDAMLNVVTADFDGGCCICSHQPCSATCRRSHLRRILCEFSALRGCIFVVGSHSVVCDEGGRNRLV